MAATPAEIASSLTIDEIPVKLRCAACNKLANNAFRTPCCDQAICEDCQSSLPQACPICLHEPVKAEDCRPNKALRTTIKVFLKKKGIEREAARKKEMVDQAAATPASQATTQAHETPDGEPSQAPVIPSVGDVEIKYNPAQGSDGVSNQPETVNASDSQNHIRVRPEDAQMDIARPSIESPNEEIQHHNSEGTGSGINGVQEKVDQSEQEQEQQDHRQDQHVGPSEQWSSVGGIGNGMNGNGFGFDGTNGFPNMGFTGTLDFSQMMQFMPNGMPNNTMSAFPNMMSIPGMGLDPMTMSQGMYGGFGGQSMGMNGMNVGMGFNAGQGAFGGFNGQSGAWNTGQDKFNQSAYGGHANGIGGDFGHNAGYGGYNMPSHQGNFNQMHHQHYPNNDFQNGYNGQGFHNRGRGRGRGYYNAGRARGGYNQVMPGNHTNYEPFHHQIPQQLAQQDSSQQQVSPQVNQQPAKEDPQNSQTEGTGVDQAGVDKAADEQLAKELEPGDIDDGARTPRKPTNTEDAVAESMQTSETTSMTQNKATVESPPKQEGEEKPAAIETFISGERTEPKINPIDIEINVPSSIMPPPSHVVPLGPAALYSGEQHPDYASKGRGGRGVYRGTPDYRVGMRGRGSGYLSNGTAHHSTTGQPNPVIETLIIPLVEPKGLGVEGAPKAPKALREGLPNTGLRGGRGFSIVGRASAAAQGRSSGYARSKSRSRSPSPSRHSHRHRSHRHRSVSSSDSSDRERRRERHRRRSRKYEDKDDASEEVKESRTGETSGESKRSTRRSHRDVQKDRDGVRSSHHSHRSREERSRERGEETRSYRNQSKSPDNEMNVVKPTDNRHKNKHEESVSSRKRRDRDEEDNHRDRDRKRSKPGYPESSDNKENHTRSRHSKHDETELNSRHETGSRSQDKPSEKSKSSPKKPELDHHELEREARNRERLQKELQRREAMEGKPSAGKNRDSLVNGRVGGGGRRMSYKYEDEETNEARATRVESEREAGRWG